MCVWRTVLELPYASTCCKERGSIPHKRAPQSHLLLSCMLFYGCSSVRGVYSPRRFPLPGFFPLLLIIGAEVAERFSIL